MSQANGKPVAQSSPVIVPGAQANQEISIPAVAGAEVQFQFDPTTATVDRVDNNLVFTLDNGGKVTITDFFVTDGQALPMLALPDGQVVPSEAVLTALNSGMDLSTAAGPAARPPSSGGTSYEDSAGSLIGGTDRLGSLGTDFWGNTLSQQEQGIGTLETPGGTFSFGVSSDAGGSFGVSGGLYEDGMAHQNTGDMTVAYGKLNFSFTGTGTTVVDGVSLTGFPVGTVIYIGNPANPTQTITIGSASQPVPLTYAQLTGEGVYLLPPPNSDADMSINARVTLVATSSGVPQTLEGNFTIVVDAVADLPLDLTHNGTVITGYDGNTYSEAAHGDSIAFTMSATFGDIADGSENHYLLLQVPQGWGNPNGYDIVTIDGTDYYYIEANSTNMGADGKCTVTFELTAPQSGDLTKVEFKNGALAVEGSIENGVIVPRDEEGTGTGLRNDNNTSLQPGNLITVDFNTVNSDDAVAGAVTDGYEDGKSAIHTSATAGTENGVISVALDAANNDHIYGTKAGETAGNGSGNTAVEITFSFGGTTLGSFEVGGNTYSLGNGITDNGDGTYTLKVPATDLPKTAGGSTGLAATYHPDVNDDTDLTDISVKVNVQADTSSGHGLLEADMNGDTSLVVDAVADRPDDLKISSDYGDAAYNGNSTLTAFGDGKGAVAPETEFTTDDMIAGNGGWAQHELSGKGVLAEARSVTFTVTATFDDYKDGSEEHFVLLKVPATGAWSAEGAETVSLHVDASGNIVNPNADGSYPAGTTTANYYKIPVSNADIQAGNGTVQVPVQVTFPEGTGEDLTNGHKVEVLVGAEEKNVHGSELNLSNNLAINSGLGSQTIYVNSFSGTFTMKAGWAYEGNLGNKDGGTAIATPDGFDTKAHSETQTTSNGLTQALGAPIQMGWNAGPGEEIKGAVTFTWDPTQGTLVNSAGVSIASPAGQASVNVADLTSGKIYFRPTYGSTSDSDVNLSYKVTITDGSTTYNVEGKLPVVIDAVADLAKITTTGVDYEDNHTAAAGGIGEVITLKVGTNFVDATSEKHYIMVDAKYIDVNGEKTLEFGLADGQKGNLVTLYKDAAGNIIMPIGGDHSASGTAYKDVFLIDVTGDKTGAAEYDVHLKSLVEHTKDESGTFTVSTVTEEQVGLGGGANSGKEYDTSNNLAIDSNSIDYKYDISVLDGGLSVSASTVYEDNQPWQHTGSSNVKPGGITVALTDNGDGITEHIGTIDGATDPNGPAIEVTFSFTPNPATTPLGTFSYNGHTYTLDNGITKNDDGSYTLRVPAADVAANSSSVTLQYKASGYDDTDLAISQVTVGAVAEGSGSTGNYSTSYPDNAPLEVKVDAVANKPTTGAAITNIDLDGKGYTAIGYGDTITVTVSATFTDTTDGSEHHYLMVEKQPGWTCEDAGVQEVSYGGKTYFYVEVPQNTSAADHTFTLKAPADSTKGTLTDNGVTLSQGGLAVEGSIENGVIKVSDSAKQEEANLNPALDATYGNNVAFDNKNTQINVNVINSVAQGTLTPAVEDHNPNQHTGGAAPVNSTDGTITLGIGNGTTLGQGGATGEHMTGVSFEFTFAGETPGTFTYKIGGTSYTLSPNEAGDTNGASYTFSDGKWHVTLPPASFTGAGSNAADSVTFRYNAPANDSTDLKGFEYTINVAADNSSATGTLTGTGTLVVDAVADQAVFTPVAPGDITYPGDQTSAKPNDTVNVALTVAFDDWKDGSEKQYIRVIDTNWTTSTFAHTGLPLIDVKNATGTTLGKGIDVTSFIDDAYAALGNQPGTHTFANGITVTIGSDGKASVSLDLDVAIKSNAPDGGGNIQVQAVTVDKETGTGETSTNTANDTSTSTIDVPITVGRATTEKDVTLSLSIGDDPVYENDQPNANLGSSSTTTPVKDDPVGATISLDNLKANDAAEVTLYLSPKDGSAVDFNSTKPMYVEYDGVKYYATGPNADGKWEITIPGVNAQDGTTMTFHPGYDYNSKDIDFTYKIQITDPTSGEKGVCVSNDPNITGAGIENVANERPPLTIEVDAVAQQPVIDDASLSVAYDNGGTAALPGDNLTVKVAVTFEDYTDGSESHYIKVQVPMGWEAKSLNVYDEQGTVVAVIDPGTFQFSGNSGYITFPVDNTLIQAAGGKITVGVNYTVDADAALGTQNLEITAGAHETLSKGDAEATGLNNDATDKIVVKDVLVDKTPEISLSLGGAVYEYDAENANVGSATRNYGTDVTYDVSNGGELQDITFNYDATHGSIILVPADKYDAFKAGTVSDAEIATWKHAGNGETFTAADLAGNKLVYMPGRNGQGDYTDADVKIEVEATLKSEGGAIYSGSAEKTVVWDAVAQRPEDVGGDVDTQVSFNHGQTVTLGVHATFKDFAGTDEYAEKMFVLVQKLPGSALFMKDGAEITATIVGPDGNSYYKIPVSRANGLVDEYGKVNFDVDYKTPNIPTAEADKVRIAAVTIEDTVQGEEVTYHNNYAINNEGKFVDLTGGGSGGNTDYWTHYKNVVVHPVYENDTPNADEKGHEHTPQGGGKLSIGVDGEFDYSPITGATLTFDSSKGAIALKNPDGTLTFLVEGETVDGVTVTYNGDQITVTLDPGANPNLLGNLQFVPGDFSKDTLEDIKAGNYDQKNHYNYNDEDVKIDFNVKTEAKPEGNVGSNTIIVDAVAQRPEGPEGEDFKGENTYESHGVDSSYNAMGTQGHNDEVTIKVPVTFQDTQDGSEAHYILVEAVPGIAVVGGTMVYVEGKAYYQVLDTNNDGNITLRLTDPGVLDNIATPNAEGVYTLNLQVGGMTVEKNQGNGADREYDLTNNVAWNVDGTASINISLVQSQASLKISGAYEHGNDPGHQNGHTDAGVDANAGKIVLSGIAESQADEATQVELTFTGKAHLALNGQPLVNGIGVTITTSGSGESQVTTIIITDKAIIDALQNKPGAGSVNLVPEGYGDADISFTGKVTVTDTHSGQTITQNVGGTVTVDAVAHGPEVANASNSTVNGVNHVAVTLNFEDVGNGEVHYAVLEQQGTWSCDSVTINGVVCGPVVTLYDNDNKPYFAVKIPDNVLENGKAEVNFSISGAQHGRDVDSVLQVGGVSVENTTGAASSSGGKELTLANNWDMHTADVTVGIVETTKVEFVIDTLLEGAADGMATISLSAETQQALADHNEVVTEADFAVTQSGLTAAMVGKVIGTIIYDGAAYEITVVKEGNNYVGKVHVDFGPEGFDASKAQLVWGTVTPDGQGGFNVTNWNHNANDLTLSSSSTVTDKNSGDTVEGVKGGGTWDLTPTATPPENVDITSDDSVKVNAGTATGNITITANFPDTDGSEQHFILVERPAAGWTCTGVSGVNGSIGTETYDGKTYFKIPVNNALADPTVNIKLTPPANATPNDTVTLSVGAMTTENGNSEYLFQEGAQEDTLHITIGGIVTTAATMTIANFEEGGSSPLHFNLAGTAEDNYVSKVTVNIPTGFKIVGTDGSTYTAGNGRVLSNVNLLDNGGYSLVPTNPNYSGTVPNLTYTVTVTQEGTGASKTFPASGTQALSGVTVTPVVDVPDTLDDTYASTVVPGHTANLTATLKANFADTDGSEQHFFLVKLPEGVTLGVNTGLTLTEVTDQNLLDRFGGGPLWRVNTPNATAQSVALNLVLSKASGVDDIKYVAGSEEKALLATDPDNAVAYSEDMGTVSVPDTVLNIAPDAKDTTGTFNTTKYPGTSGAVDATDKDTADTITVTKVEHSGSTTITGTDDKGAYFEVAGQYGTLRVYADGKYTYTMDDAFKGQAGKETFTYTVDDGHGGTDSASIVINLANTNSPPTVSGDLTGSVGSTTTVYAGGLQFADADNDAITSIKVTLNGTTTQLVGSGGLTLAGKYGTLVIAENGTYTYTLNAAHEHMTGKETFTLTLADEFGTSSPFTVNINISPVNHAPVIGDNTIVFDPTYSYLSGELVFSDVDMAHQGDTLSLWVKGILVTGEEYTRFAGESGDLFINGKGEYTYTPHEGTSPADLPAGILDAFEFKVIDSHGVSSDGNLQIGLGSDSLHIENINGAYKIYGSSHAEEIAGSAGNDTVFAFDGDDTIHGGTGHDYIHGGAGNDLIEGGVGNDTIYGGEGNDTIYGGEGNDLIFAGKGDDVLFGGPGADTFAWGVYDHDNGTDIIRDFSAQEGDKLCIGILGKNGEVLNLHDVLDSGDNDLDVYLDAEVNLNGITLNVHSGNVEQTIIIEMGAGAVAGYESYQSFVDQFQNTQDEEAQSAMVQHLLTSITC